MRSGFVKAEAPQLWSYNSYQKNTKRIPASSLGSVTSTIIPEGMPECASDWLVLPMQSPSLEKAPGIGENLHLRPPLGVSTSGTENRRNLAGSLRTPDFEISINGFIANKHKKSLQL